MKLNWKVIIKFFSIAIILSLIRALLYRDAPHYIYDGFITILITIAALWITDVKINNFFKVKNELSRLG